MKRTNVDTLELEIDISALLARASDLLDRIKQHAPPEQLYTLTGEINRASRWGTAYWQLLQLISNLRNRGF